MKGTSNEDEEQFEDDKYEMFISVAQPEKVGMSFIHLFTI